jgi:hypothetical protein
MIFLLESIVYIELFLVFLSEKHVLFDKNANIVGRLLEHCAKLVVNDEQLIVQIE